MNLPNRITVARICLIPLFVFFYMADFIPGGYGKLAAAFVFAVASFTDFLDGKIARKRGLVTNLGKFLDPIADKVLVMAGLLLICAYPITAKGGVNPAAPAIAPVYVGAIFVIVVLARELIVSAFRQIAATKNFVIAADMYGKVKTVFQMITLIYYFILAFMIQGFYANVAGTAFTVLNIIGYVLIVITTILTIISGFNYIWKNRQVFKDEKKNEN